jgi:putative Ca2+/H+ antiporter (TMEM165/GDT1 family)
VVAAVVAVLFAIGAVVLLRGEEEPDEEVAAGQARSPLSMAAASFGVLFAAEWGDASQLGTAALAARYRDPIGVFAGAFVALVAVAALAIVLGQAVTRRVPLRLVQRVAGVIFAVFALIAAVEAVRG